MKWQRSWPHPLGILCLIGGVWLVFFWLALMLLATRIAIEGLVRIIV